MLNLKVWMLTLATWTTVTYLICILWGLVAPEGMHMHQALEIVLPGFRWLTPGGFLVGLVLSFLYGIYAGLVFVPVHNFFHRRWGGGV